MAICLASDDEMEPMIPGVSAVAYGITLKYDNITWNYNTKSTRKIFIENIISSTPETKRYATSRKHDEKTASLLYFTLKLLIFKTNTS